MSQVTTGAPIYLVSACASGEEFVAAFRRYADRNGVVFVPIADPLPAGKKGRFALTLTDGGVMVEGDAEVVSAARTPSVLYGRVGMTLKFLVPDEPSKTTLGELEKARLALKPSPPTIAPRPATIPAEPRPKPPSAAGRIDHVNALAECVAIGEGIPAPAETGELPPKNASPKFVVPSLPSLPPGRSRPVSKPPPTPTILGVAPLQREAPVDLEPTMRGPAPAVDLTKPAREELSVTVRGTQPAAAITARNPPPASTPPPVPPPRPPTPAAALPVVKSPRMATPFAPMPIVQQPAAPIVAAAKPPAPEVEISDPTDLTGIPQVEDELVATSHENDSAPIPVARKAGEQTGKLGREGRRTVMGVAVVPSGVMVLPAAPAIRMPSAEETRDTSEMTAQTPISQIGVRGDAVNDSDALSATLRPQLPLRASMLPATVEEPTPSGDWTMTPGVNGPTIVPTPRDKLARAGTAPAPQGPQTGDWMIALDPSQPDGWTEPSKVDARPIGESPPGPPVSVVSSARALDSNRRLGTEPSIVDSAVDKVQVDPTLIGPLIAMPDLGDDADEPALPPPPSTAHPVAEMEGPGFTPGPGEDGLMPIPTSMQSDPRGPYEAPPMPGAMAHHVPGSIPNNVFTPPAGLPHLAAASGATPVFSAPQPFAPPRVATEDGSGFFRESGDIPSYASGSTLAIADDAGRKRLIVIIASAVGVAILGIILLLVLGGGDAKPPTVAPSKTDNTEKPDPATPPSTQNVAVTPNPTIDAAEAGKFSPDPVVAPESLVDCKLSVSSVPSGAEVVIGKTVVGTTPTALTLPCGAETKLVLRKARYVAATRAVTPNVGTKPIKVALAKVTFAVKVSSTPPGASITVGGKPMGFTPTTVKLPAFESSTLKIAKDGFTVDAQKITPKQNNQTVHATLKRTTKRR